MTSRAGSANGLTLVAASAGSGKTHRLTQEVTRALDPAHPDAIDVRGLVAVTYTTKARAELESRLRRALYEKGQFRRAQELPLAHIGTVHAVCLRLIKEFALDLGVSPTVDGLPQEEGRRLLQQALESELSQALQARLNEFSDALQTNYDGRTGQYDWISRVDEIMTLARNNRIDPNALQAMAQRSLDGMYQLIGPSASDGALMERDLAAAIDDALSAIGRSNDRTKTTQNATQRLERCKRQLGRGCLRWSEWNAIVNLSPAKASLPLVSDLQQIAAQYERHPRFRSDIRGLCESVFEAAAVGLQAYADLKARRGLVDYIDMIDRTLTALDRPTIETEIRERLRLLVVDEFQDTSPVQLALFARLHTFGGRSVWVGDQKQCIFEYAGADPGLMDSVSEWASQNGGRRETLGRNYRSRPELVDAVSDIFTAAFAVQGQSRDEVATTAARTAASEQAALPPFGVWRLQREKGGLEHEALANGIEQLLSAPQDTPIVDRSSGDVRPLRAGDLAVLVASNREAERLASSLATRGIPSSLPRTGLMKTPEGSLLDAALRFLVDRRDTLASAELEALLGFGGQSHELWLNQRISARSARSRTENQADQPAPSSLQALEALRGQVADLSPAEAVDRVLSVLKVTELSCRWPDPQQRMGNLEALRSLAKAYEDRCVYLRESASLAGLTRYFDETQIQIRQLDEERASDEQHVGRSDDAVAISTYHKSKGLEWPVVVLASLGRERRRDAFDVTPESDRAEFDPSDPLGGRWIRYWPWPLGQQRKAALRERAEASAVGKRITQRDARERVRLLYVGFTRARDHLILALGCDSKGKASVSWLDELTDETGPLLALPELTDAEPKLRLRTETPRTETPHTEDRAREFPARLWSLSGTRAEETKPKEEPRTWFASARASSRVPFVIEPSLVAASGAHELEARVVDQLQFTQRISFNRPDNRTWDEVGDCLHAFLAADREELGRSRRLGVAQRILQASTLADAFSPDSLLAASDALRLHVRERWPDATWHREVPVRATLSTPDGTRRIRGTIDLLLETPLGVVVIDHKSFPGRTDQWSDRALGYAPQLFTYAQALRAAGKPVTGMFIHFMIGGGLVELATPTAA